jgi:hypothetical protein
MLNVRDLIYDNHQREGIVIELINRPSAAWILDQNDKRIEGLPEGELWWRVFPIAGGSVIVPGSLATRIREATYEDVMKAIEGGNEAARRELAFIFPDVLEAAHRRRLEKNG